MFLAVVVTVVEMHSVVVLVVAVVALLFVFLGQLSCRFFSFPLPFFDGGLAGVIPPHGKTVFNPLFCNLLPIEGLELSVSYI